MPGLRRVSVAVLAVVAVVLVVLGADRMLATVATEQAAAERVAPDDPASEPAVDEPDAGGKSEEKDRDRARGGSSGTKDAGEKPEKKRTPPQGSAKIRVDESSALTSGGATAKSLSDLAALAEDAAQQPTTDPFVVAMFNILGSQHTRAGGTSPGYGSGVSRARAAAALLRSRGASVIGFSEIQRDQLAVVLRANPSFRAYPGTSLGGKGVPQSLVWDSSVWKAVQVSTFRIPFSGQVRPQPVVLLEYLATGAQVWFVNIHNSPQDMVRERARALAIELQVVRKLTDSGLPVVLTGDFNDRRIPFCTITSRTSLRSAVGGSNGPGGCRLPPRPRVDWIFASPSLAVQSWVADRRPPVPRITDHAVFFSRLQLS